MTIRALIVDDEQLARDEMRFLLEGMEEVAIVGEAAGGEEAVRLAGELSPDLLFLDIQMPVLDGFGVVRRLIERGAPPLVVFTTAYDQYAIRAFEIHAVDYLLKPIDRERLAEALRRAKDSLPARDAAIEKLRRLTVHIKAGRKFLPRLVVRRGEGLDLVDAGRVSLVECVEDGVLVHTDTGDYLSNYADLDELDVQLDPAVFLRLGPDHIVNIRRIARVVPWSGGHYVLSLDDASSTELTLSRTQAQLLKNRVEGF